MGFVLFEDLKISEGYQSLTPQAFVYQQVDVSNTQVIKHEPNKTLSKKFTYREGIDGREKQKLCSLLYVNKSSGRRSAQAPGR